MSPSEAHTHPPSGSTFKRKLIRFSLTLIGTLSGLALCAGIGLWSLTVPIVSERLEYDARYLAERLARELEIAAAAEDVQFARERVEPFTKDPDFGGVAVRLADGRSLLSLPAKFETWVRTVDDWTGEGVTWSDGLVTSSKAIEVEGTELGRVFVAHSAARLQTLQHGFYAFGLTILLFMAGSTWYAVRFDRRFVAPLRRIIEFAHQIGRDELETRIDESGATAEVQELVSELNRTAGMLEERRKELVAAREAAEDLSEIKSRFLANMSHEMRTPLNGVIGMTELILDNDPPAEIREDLTVVQASAAGLLDIIEDVLDISKIEAGEVVVERIPADLGEVVKTALFSVIPGARKKGIRVRAALGPGVPLQLRTDPTRVRQIILNLLSNAVKFTAEGTVEVSISVVGDLVRISVADEGIGMSPEQLALVYEPFRQADVSTTRKFGGTGLGLAISRNLAELLGGRLEADSELGRGSTFHLELPLDAIAEGPAEATAADTWAVAGPSPWAEALRARLLHASLKVVEVDAASTVIVCGETEAEADAALAAVAARTEAPRRTVAVVQPDQVGDGSPFPGVQTVPEPAFVEQLVRAQAPRPTRRTASSDLGAGLRVLVAEDNLVNQRVVVRMLGRLGIDATVVADGALALAAATADDAKFDAVLMDLQMPNMGGLEASRRIREAGAQVPIIALTADAMSTALHRCQEAGMNGYLSKPLKLDRLAAELARHFGLRPPPA